MNAVFLFLFALDFLLLVMLLDAERADESRRRLERVEVRRRAMRERQHQSDDAPGVPGTPAPATARGTKTRTRDGSGR